MKWWEWAALGIVIWLLAVWFVVVANMRFWNYIDPEREWRK